MQAPSPRVWLLTFFGLVLLTGVSLGVLVDRAWLLVGPPPARQAPAPLPLVGPPPEQFLDELDREVQLSPDQRQRIMNVFDSHRPRLRELQDESRNRFNDEQRALQNDIAAVLTADQAARFKKMMDARPIGIGPGRPGGAGRPGGPRERGGLR